MKKENKIESQEQYDQLIDDYTKKFWDEFIIALEDAIIEEDFYTKFDNDYRNRLKSIIEGCPTVGLTHNFLWQWRFDHNSKKLNKNDFEILSILCEEKQVGSNDFFYANAEYIACVRNYQATSQYRVRNVTTHSIETGHTNSKSKIFWRKNNETEFVQFIYALYEAGYINNEESHKTKLVEQMASVFNYTIGKNWQSNFSSSINDRNTDYKPRIFENLENGFSKYRDKQIAKKEKK